MAYGFFGQFTKDFTDFEPDINVASLILSSGYISKIGFCYHKKVFPMQALEATENTNEKQPVIIKIKTMDNTDEQEFQLGKTGMLELQDVRIIGIWFKNVKGYMTIDYQITKAKETTNNSVFPANT